MTTITGFGVAAGKRRELHHHYTVTRTSQPLEVVGGTSGASRSNAATITR
jgi:hypothetical protein